MRTDLVPAVGDHPHLIGERLDRVTGNEPARLQIQLLEQLQEARRPHLAGPNASLDVRRRVGPAVRPDPPGNGIDIDPDGREDLLGHASLLGSVSAERGRAASGQRLLVGGHEVSQPGQAASRTRDEPLTQTTLEAGRLSD